MTETCSTMLTVDCSSVLTIGHASSNTELCIYGGRINKDLRYIHRYTYRSETYIDTGAMATGGGEGGTHRRLGEREGPTHLLQTYTHTHSSHLDGQSTQPGSPSQSSEARWGAIGASSRTRVEREAWNSAPPASEDWSSLRTLESTISSDTATLSARRPSSSDVT